MDHLTRDKTTEKGGEQRMKALMAMMALVIGLAFGTATFVRADEPTAPAPAAPAAPAAAPAVAPEGKKAEGEITAKGEKKARKKVAKKKKAAPAVSPEGK